MDTLSVYCSPETVDPSPYSSENVWPKSVEVEEEEGSQRV